MSTKDHDEAVAGIHLSLGGFLVLTLVIGPFLLKRDLGRHPDQIPVIVIVFVVLLAIAVLLISTALAMNKKKPVGRKLTLWAAPFLSIPNVLVWWNLRLVVLTQRWRQAMCGAKEDE